MLTSINGCQLVYTIRTHHYLQRVVHLIPENALIGANDTLPGVAEAFRSGKTPGLGMWEECGLTTQRRTKIMWDNNPKTEQKMLANNTRNMKRDQI